jgi:hypothetical protein
MAPDPDATRTKVVTYLPAYQRDRWGDHAEELGMNRSEFVRTMVQAGRRGFGAEERDKTKDGADETGKAGERGDAGDAGGGKDGRSSKPVEGRSADAAPRGEALEERVLDALDDGARSWEELVEEVTDDIEARLDTVLERLQDDNRVRYSGRDGGYTRTGGE